MSADWWNPHGVCRPLHSMNRLRVPLIRDGLINSGVTNLELAYSDKPLEGLKILGKYLSLCNGLVGNQNKITLDGYGISRRTLHNEKTRLDESHKDAWI